MIYCDTSLLVAALTIEPSTDAVRVWISRQESGVLCTSNWTATEFSSALGVKFRHGMVADDDRVTILSNWRIFQLDYLTVLPVPQEAFVLAARYCDMRDTALRASDALHLAVASLGGHRLATLDVRMMDAASAAGVKVVGIS